ncbi:MAG: hypothetical protein GF388_03575 [Candidatus Aegiribacteria sp.]|nr:hypothetical protein [Candidatus Aegiribacteria sp.]MBD3294343.1 hypothetical protein [Candidatus Fermentibacteria bacterium]
MNLKEQWKPLTLITVVFLAALFMPVGMQRLEDSVMESLYLMHDYAREHVVLCLLPAFLIAGAISVFVKGSAVMKYLGAGAKKVVAYAVASVSGSVLAVCSCTVLPLFAGIYKRGAGLGPATAFLYSGPAINVLAIILTARILGLGLGVARAVGAVVFSVVIGLMMHLIFRKEEKERVDGLASFQGSSEDEEPLHRTVSIFALLIAVLVFANWGVKTESPGFWNTIFEAKWWITGAAAFMLGVFTVKWMGVALWKVLASSVAVVSLLLLTPESTMLIFGAGLIAFAISLGTSRGRASQWLDESWSYAKLIMPLLFFGILVAGFLLGRPGMEGMIPSELVEGAVGGNSLLSNLFASIAGAFMYFATLTEVPILQGLMGAGMGKGPALALLLAGPALSLPNMLVIRSVLGTRKTITYVSLVVVMATISGVLYGTLV